MGRSVSRKRVPTIGGDNLRTEYFHTIHSISLVIKFNVRLEGDFQPQYPEMGALLESGGAWMHNHFCLPLERREHRAPSVTLLESLCG
jgi:hypothetical protein